MDCGVAVEFARTLLGLWCWLPFGVRAVFCSPKCAFRIGSRSCTADMCSRGGLIRLDELYPSGAVDVCTRGGLLRLDELCPVRAVDVWSRGGLMRRGACARSYALWYCELLLAVCRGGGG